MAKMRPGFKSVCGSGCGKACDEEDDGLDDVGLAEGSYSYFPDDAICMAVDEDLATEIERSMVYYVFMCAAEEKTKKEMFDVFEHVLRELADCKVL